MNTRNVGPIEPEPLLSRPQLGALSALAGALAMVAVAYIAPTVSGVWTDVRTETGSEKALVSVESQQPPRAHYQFRTNQSTMTVDVDDEVFAEMRAVVEVAVKRSPSLWRLKYHLNTNTWVPSPEVVQRYEQLALRHLGETRTGLRHLLLDDLLGCAR